MSEQDRRECWSCGSTNVWVEDWNGPIYIKCHGCKVRIGPYDDEPAAIAAWNQRAGDAELAALRKLCGEVKVAEESLVSAMLEGPVESGMVSDHQRRLSAALNTYDETIKGAENE